MEKEGFFINSKSLSYVYSDQKLLNNFSDEYETAEAPSVFYLNIKYQDEIYLPVTIFQNDFTPLQTVIKYLKENLDLPNRKIAQLLNRDMKAIWAAYRDVKKKSLVVKETQLQIPLSIFKDNRLSIAESLASFLKQLDLKYSEIARLLNKDQRTIWTLCARARAKIEFKNNLKKKQNNEIK